MNRLVLIDGNAILHRAYHALPPLTAPDGSLVNAVYGFATIVFKLFENLKPSHMAVAFDRPKPTFRKALYEGYQAKRPKMDDELAGQIDRVHRLVAVLGIPIFEKDGFEADDVIGTLATRVLKSKRVDEKIDQVIIVTGDRDILQLVEGEKVLVYMPTKGLSEGKLYGEKEVKERMGISPRSIVDFKALAGDASDNYPGVAGIGPKTAVQLLAQYGSLQGIYDAVQKKKIHTTGAVLTKLISGEKDARLSYTLAAIRRDVPIEGNLVATATFDSPAAREFLGNLHFHSLLKKIGGEEKPHEKPNEKKKTASEQQQLF